jgi:hypothetical protein
MNLNIKPNILSTLQASGADVVTSGGVLYVTGVSPIPVNNISAASVVATDAGKPSQYLITVPSNTFVANTTYQFTIRVQTPTITFTSVIIYPVEATAPAAADGYLAIKTLIDNQISNGGLVGSTTSSGSGVVYTVSSTAGVASIVPSTPVIVAQVASVLTAAGSSATDATPRVLTAGAAHGLTVGKAYSFTFSGVTGTGAADLNRSLIGIPLDADEITLLDTSNTGATNTTAATLGINVSSTDTFANILTGVTGYNPTSSYVGVLVEYLSDSPLEAGVKEPQLILADATANTVANVNAFLTALVNATVDIL